MSEATVRDLFRRAMTHDDSAAMREGLERPGTHEGPGAKIRPPSKIKTGI